VGPAEAGPLTGAGGRGEDGVDPKLEESGVGAGSLRRADPPGAGGGGRAGELRRPRVRPGRRGGGRDAGRGAGPGQVTGGPADPDQIFHQEAGMAGKSRLERLRQGEGGGRPQEAGVDGRRGEEAGEHHGGGRRRGRAGSVRFAFR